VEFNRKIYFDFVLRYESCVEFNKKIYFDLLPVLFCSTPDLESLCPGFASTPSIFVRLHHGCFLLIFLLRLVPSSSSAPLGFVKVSFFAPPGSRFPLDFSQHCIVLVSLDLSAPVDFLLKDFSPFA
jgi:hypothetical protein